MGKVPCVNKRKTDIIARISSKKHSSHSLNNMCGITAAGYIE
jgi:hypothetical protein